MKSGKKKLLEITVIFFCVLIMYPGVNVKAKDSGAFENLKNGFKETVVYTPADKKGHYLAEVKNIKVYQCKNFKASSTNKSVVEAKYSKKDSSFLLIPKKAGTAKVTFTAVKNKKTITCKGTIKVVKFANPLKELKVDAKNYAGKVKTPYNNIFVKTKKAEAKFSYKLQPGWKIIDAIVRNENGNDSSVDQKFKNNATYSLKKGNLLIDLTLKNKKRGEIIRTLLFVER